jgi:hypothetical protein
VASSGVRPALDRSASGVESDKRGWHFFLHRECPLSGVKRI